MIKFQRVNLSGLAPSAHPASPVGDRGGGGAAIDVETYLCGHGRGRLPPCR